MSTLVHWEDNGVCVACTDRISCADLVIVLESIGCDARFDGLWYIIIDFSGVVHLDFSMQGASIVAALDYAYAFSNRRLLRAFVGAGGSSSTASIMHWVTVSEFQDRARHCETADQAREWIELQRANALTARKSPAGRSRPPVGPEVTGGWLPNPCGRNGAGTGSPPSRC